MPLLCNTTSVETPSTCNNCNPEIKFARIDSWRFRFGVEAFTDFSDTTEWDARLSDTEADTTEIKYIRTIYGTGSVGEASQDEIALSLDRVTYSDAVVEAVLEVDDICDANYDLYVYLRNNPGTQAQLWYTTKENVFGSNTGLTVSLSCDLAISNNRKEIQKLVFKAKIIGQTPERELLPIALKYKE